MIEHTFVQCHYCQKKILLHFQMGYFDIPFDICCPNCGVHINGLKRIVNEHDIIINNASIIEEDLYNLDYYADFSVELPHAKTTRFESIESYYKSQDCNAFLRELDLDSYKNKYHTLLLYDPYNASIDWDAITPYLNRWGEVIINHMSSDTARGISQAKKSGRC